MEEKGEKNHPDQTGTNEPVDAQAIAHRFTDVFDARMTKVESTGGPGSVQAIYNAARAYFCDEIRNGAGYDSIRETANLLLNPPAFSGAGSARKEAKRLKSTLRSELTRIKEQLPGDN